ncbi:unnamed protein product [Cochlearia groenlandica]
MDNESRGGSITLPPFLTKTYEMVDDSASDSIVSWTNNYKSFLVKNQAEFSRDLLPRFFKHQNFSSFIRQLNTYGFRKVDPEKWEFANDDFVRGKPYLMKNIHRRKPVHSHSLHTLQAQDSLTESERQNMKEHIERLRRDKQVLLCDLQSQEKERKGFELQVTALKDQLTRMEQHQRSIESSFLEKVGLSLNTETHQRRKRRSLESSHADQVKKLESWLTFWENLVTESCEKSSLQSSPSRNMDLDDSTESISIEDTTTTTRRPESLKIDMNSEPVTAAAKKTRVNDEFWEQCLTENPEQQEVQSERRDVGARKGDNGNKKIVIGQGRTFWWNECNVNNNNVTERKLL